MDLDTIIGTVQPAVAHAGIGTIGALAAYGACNAYNAFAHNDSSRYTMLAVIAGVAAGMAGPEMLGPISEYLHQPTAGGIALGTLGAATLGAAAGFTAGYLPDGTNRSLGGFFGGVIGTIGTTAIYLGAQAANYMR
jgi:hypothetical protein